MIPAAMAEFQFIGLSPVRQRDQLVPQTNAEKGVSAVYFLHRSDGFRYVLRIAGTVREKYAVRFQFRDLFRCDIVRDDGDIATARIQAADDVEFDSAVHRDDVVSRVRRTAEPAFLQLTAFTASCGTGVSRMMRIPSSAETEQSVISARRVPASRMLRVSLRVSIPVTPGIP